MRGCFWSITYLFILSLIAGQNAASAQPDSGTIAVRAQAIFAKSCTGSICHGGGGSVKFNATVRDSILAAKVVLPKQAAGSKLLQVVSDGSMPLNGTKLPDRDIKTIRDWIDAGAPDWNVSKPGAGATAGARKPVSEKELLQAIVRDLEAADERKRPFLRYYSLANLYNNADEINESLLALYRTSLSKLVNHLSWNPEVVAPKTVGPSGTLLRIDLRDYDWTPAIWQRIIAAYPYGLRARNLGGAVDQIRALSGVDLPYIRADWFVANASVPPLYHDILQLPESPSELERRLNVDAAADIAQEKCIRAGLRNSGISRSNRVVERHRSAYGAYWKSFDFADNRGPKNIFLNPVNFREDGGEFIFNLPNGLQGYFVANSAGKRLNEAPITIVRDRNKGDEPVVRNGRSCIGCHTGGMNTFTDEVRPGLETQQKADFDLPHALKLYVPQEELTRLFQLDNARFERAVLATGSALPKNPQEEPINLLGLRYEGDMSVAQAAADVGLEVKEFQSRIARSSELERLGFGQLQGVNGGIKRDVWEENFGNVVEELRLGDYLKPERFIRRADGSGADGRLTVSLGSFQGDDAALAQRARQKLFVLLDQSAELRVVSDRAERKLIGSVTRRGDTLTVTVRELGADLQEEAQGSEKELDFLVLQLANRLHLRITGSGLAPPQANNAIATAAAPAATFAAAADPLGQLPLALGGNGPVHIALSVDRGPGATYRGGEPVVVRFKVDKDCFLQLKNLDAAGNVVNLFPNEHTPSGHIVAGQVYSLTDAAGKNIISVDPNGVFGQETILAFATLEEDDLPVPKSKTLKVEGTGASQFAGDVKAKARKGAVSSALVRFNTVK